MDYNTLINGVVYLALGIVGGRVLISMFQSKYLFYGFLVLISMKVLKWVTKK